MSTDAVEREIVRIICDEFLLGSDRAVQVDAPLGELGAGLDSLAIVNIVAAVEAAFAVEFPDDALTSRRSLSIRDLTEMVTAADRRHIQVSISPHLDPAVPHPHYRMERLEYKLRARGRAGQAVWAAARIAWPAKRVLYAYDTHVLLERDVDNDVPAVEQPPGIELRSYVPEDEARLSGLWPDFMESWGRRKLTRWLDEGAIPFVASDGHRIFALDLLSKTGDSGEIELRSARDACWGLYLAEAPDARGRKIGLALLAHSLRMSRDLGFRFQLTAVRDDNAPMLAACMQLLGFRPIGRARRARLLGLKRWDWDVNGRRSRGPCLVL